MFRKMGKMDFSDPVDQPQLWDNGRKGREMEWIMCK